MKVDEEPDILDTVESQRLKWYGHLRRMNDSRQPKKLQSWVPPGKRKRGRPRKTWMDGVQEAMNNKGLNENDWEDKKTW